MIFSERIKIYCNVSMEDEMTSPVSLPGESHGQRSLAGYGPRGRRAGRDSVTTTTMFYYRHSPTYIKINIVTALYLRE